MINQKKAIKQLSELKKLGKELRLAADGWNADWKILIATLLSARTTDKITIPIATSLFQKYPSIQVLSKAPTSGIASTIRGVNFYKTKARNISNLAKTIMKEHNGKIPIDFDKLVELPGVGRKTANVFLAEKGHGTIGVDTHLSYCSHRLGWTDHKDQHKIEIDLQELFPKRLWGELNWIIVRFGQTYTNRRIKNEILDKIRKLR